MENLAALARILRSAGYEPKTDEPLADYDRIYVDDPSGNRIELLQSR